MANIAYFADLDDGTVLEFRDRSVPSYTDRAGMVRYKIEPAKVALRYGHLCGLTDAGPVRITRQVVMTASPSRHECDARCINATGKIMKCECSCNGKNHGRHGGLKCEAV